MPFYEYRCKTGHKWEKLKQFSEYDDEERCVLCDEIGVRLISGGQKAIFKTTGFYETDYKGKK